MHGSRRSIFSYLGRFSILMGARMAGALALFAVNLLIANKLGAESLAEFAVFVSLISVLSVCLFAGYTSVSAIFAAEYSKTDQPELLKGFIRRALINGLLSVLALAGLALVGHQLLPQWAALSSAQTIALVLTAAFGQALLGFNSTLNVGLNRQAAGLLPETLLRPLLLLLGTLVLIYSPVASGPTSVFVVIALSVWIAVLILPFANRSLRKATSATAAKEDRQRWRRAAIPWMGTTLFLDYMIDLILLAVSLIAGSVEIALLHVCFRYRVLAGFGMRTIHNLMMPEIAGTKILQDQAGLRQKLLQVNAASLAYALAVLSFFGLFGHHLLGWFSLPTETALPVLLVVTATMALRALFGPAPLILAIHDYHRVTMWASMGSLAVAAMLLFALFPIIGILAAAIGYTSANLLTSLYLWNFSRKNLGIDCSIFAVPGRYMPERHGVMTQRNANDHRIA